MSAIASSHELRIYLWILFNSYSTRFNGHDPCTLLLAIEFGSHGRAGVEIFAVLLVDQIKNTKKNKAQRYRRGRGRDRRYTELKLILNIENKWIIRVTCV